MDSNCHSPAVPSRWTFSLWTLFIVFVLFALSLALWKLGGGYVVGSTFVIGAAIGGAISVLGSNKAGATPIIIVTSSIAGALASAIFGVYAVGFDVADWDNPLGKCPIGLDDLFWFGFWGALVSANVAAFLHWLTVTVHGGLSQFSRRRRYRL